MKNIYKYLIACFLALAGLIPGRAYAIPTVCDDGNSDCYIIVTRTAASSAAWSSYMLEIRQEDYDFALALYSNQGTDTVRLCTSYGKIIMNLWDMGGGGSNIGVTVTDSLGNVLLDQYGFTTALWDATTILEAEACAGGACTPPSNITFSNVTLSSADVSFSSDASAWEYIVSTLPVYDDADWQSTTSTSFTLSGLASSAKYHLWIRSVCGEETSNPTHVQFNTPCGDITTLPLFQDFENNGLDPYCWGYFEMATSGTWWFPSPRTWSFYYNSSSVFPHGSYAMVFRPSLTTQSFYSPRINVDTPVDVIFYAVSSSVPLQVGYITDTSAGSTFHLVSTVGVVPAETYQKYIVPFPEIDEPYYVVFRVDTYSNNDLFVDDITICEQNPCPYPTNFEQDISDLSPGQVILNWEANGGTNWQIVYGPTGFDPEGDAARSVTVNEVPIVVTDLSNDTTYDFYLHTLCGENSSYWSTNKVTARPATYSLRPAHPFDTVETCSVTFFDDGGPLGNYGCGGNYLLVIRPTSDDLAVKLNGSVNLYKNSYINEAEIARLYIFEGEDTNGVCLARYSSDMVSSDTAVAVASQTGAITLWFSQPQTASVGDGFELTATCYDRPTCLSPSDFTFIGSNGDDAWFSWRPADATPQKFQLTIYDEEGHDVMSHDIDPYAWTDTLWSGLSENTAYIATLEAVCIDGKSVACSTAFRTPCKVERTVMVGNLENPSYMPDAVIGYPSLGNGLTQHIFTRSELGETLDTVYGITLYNNNSSPVTYSLDIYVDTTSKTYYDFGEWIDVDTSAGLYSHRYFSGSYTFSEGENTLLFDTPVALDADKGLVITFHNVSYAYNGYANFACNSVMPEQSVIAYGEWGYVVTDPWDNMPSDFYPLSERPVISFVAPCGDNSCSPVKFLTAEAAQTSAEISWKKGNDEVAWKVEYREENEVNWITAVSSTAVQNYTLDGLASGTGYEVRITTLCGGSDVAYRTLKFVTHCAPITIPFTLDFDDSFVMGEKINDIQHCWYRTGISDPNWVYPKIISELGYSGSNSSQWYQQGFSYYPTLITPELDADLSNMVVTFWYRCNDGVLEVGTATDPLDTSTYTLVDTAYLSAPDNTGEWQLGVVDLSSYTGSNKHIFLRANHSNTSTYTDFILDDITFQEKPACDFLVGKAAITDYNESSITVKVLSDRFGHDSYNVYCSTSEVLDPATAIKVNSSSDEILISGLNPNTTYWVWVEGDCNGNASNRIEAGSVKTWCNTLAVTREMPFTTELENESDVECTWQITGEYTTWLYFNALTSPYYPDGIATQSGMGSYYFDGDDTAMLVLPTFDFSDLDTTGELSFSNYEHVNVYTNYPPDTVSVWYRLSANAEWTKIKDIPVSLGVFTQQFILLPSSQGTAFYQVAIKGIAGGSGRGYGACLDDITVGAAHRCVPPDFELTDITDRSVTVTWNGSAYDKQRIQYREADNWAWTGIFVDGEDGSGSVEIVPLEMHTDYQIRMSAVCDDEGYSPVSGIVNFTTKFCGNSIDKVSYDATATDTTIKDGLFAVDYYGTDYLSTWQAAGYYNYAELLIDKSKMEGLTNISALAFTADSPNEGSYLESVVIYMANTTATTLTDFLFDPTFKQVYSGPAKFTEAGEVTLELDTPFEWDSTGNLIIGFYTQYPSVAYLQDALYFGAHTAPSGNFIYTRAVSAFTPQNAKYKDNTLKNLDNPFVPDIRLVACVPECYAPTVKSLASTASSVTVGWFKEKGMDVEVAIRPTGATAWENITVVKSSATSPYYTFDGLNDRTQYEVRLRRDCSASEMGYSDEVVVSIITDTLCAIPSSLTINEVTAHTVTLSWSGSDIANRWEVHVWNDDFNCYYTVESNPATIDGLTPGGAYNVSIRAFCPMSDNNVSDWSETATFQNVCAPVTGLSVKVTANKADLSWTGNAPTYLVSWGKVGSDPNEQMGHVEVNTTSYTVSNLKAQTYTFRVLSECEEGWNSAWTEANATVVGIEEVDRGDTHFTLHPNPASNHVNLVLDVFEGKADVRIISIDGRTAMHFTASDGSTEVDISELAAGTYFVQVSTEAWTSVRKLVVRN